MSRPFVRRPAVAPSARPARSPLFLLAALVVPLAAPSGAQAQGRNFDQVRIETTKLADHVAMMTGAGGNLGVCWGDDGVFLIDDQFAPLTPRIQAAIAGLSDRPVRFVLNTHWHGDHTGGNENFGRAGAVIVAQDNVRRRLSTDQVQKIWQRTVPASPPAALPVVTFTDDVTFYLNGDTIHVVHVPPAHTDGDAIVRFEHADVVHAGDVLFNGFYPVIDVDSGGSLEGMLAATDRVLQWIGPATRVVPGHGPLADRAAVEAYRAMLAAARDAIAPLVRAGKSEDEIVAAHPTAALDAAWGNGPVKADRFVRSVVAGYRAAGSR